MNNELLIEIFSEEIPARMQFTAKENAKKIFTEILLDREAVFKKVETYVSQRRIAIRVKELATSTKDYEEDKRGPKVGANEKAVQGFLKSNNKSEEDLFENNGYYFLNIKTDGQEIKNILGEIVEEFLEEMPWPKTMRWTLESTKELSIAWIRPIRSILCVYNGEHIKAHIKSVDLDTVNYTYGHRFLSTDPIRVSNFDEYATKLEKNHVMINMENKRQYIDKTLASMAASSGLCVQIDEELLNEVTGLVEYPFIHIGTIEEKFMNLPRQVLSTSMKVHQKYFTITYPDSTIAPFFGTVTNVLPTTVMTDGLNRVLRARLADASFFFKEDTDVSLDAFTQKLSTVVYHEKLGTMAQKVERMLNLSDSKEENRVITLCKADLITQMVGEFPELQGTMGEIYALHYDEPKEIATAIREHYKPAGANDDLPNTFLGSRVAFFDKLDTLVGFLGVGIFPTGSKDPFGLRRSAIGLIRLLCDSKHDVLFGATFGQYIEYLIDAYSLQSVALSTDTVDDVNEFMLDRFKVYAEDKLKDINYTCIEAVLKSYKNNSIDFKKALQDIQKLDDIIKKPEFETIYEAYKRTYGMISSVDQEISNELNRIDLNAIIPSNETMSVTKNLLTSATEINVLFFEKLSQALLRACEETLVFDSNDSIKLSNLKILFECIKLIHNNLGVLDALILDS